MIFSSVPFIFGFLPVVLLGYFIFGRMGRVPAAIWLVAASLFFYADWNPKYVPLLLGSIAWNYLMGGWIFKIDEKMPGRKLFVMWVAVAGNLGLLGYYKYMYPTIGFLSAHGLTSGNWQTQIVLPLGISFFTFTQIGYLVNSYSGEAKERGLLSYLLFVTFFPHLIAGPIYHNREIMPQLASRDTFQLRIENVAIGLSIFTMGIAKKVLLADPLGYPAGAGFNHASTLGIGGAWLTVLSYSLQLYFDFSGYSDMAIGLARMFGITFPANFNSPYKSSSIIDFWSRWHMTLTRYLTLYVYNPVSLAATRNRVKQGLPISREGMRNWTAFKSTVVFPIFFTMVLAGIWHGAGLQFLIFGLLHAFYLTINHAWRVFGPKAKQDTWLNVSASILLTYFAVLVGQIFFRAGSAGEATKILSAMIGNESGKFYPGSGVTVGRVVLCFAICLILPNTQQIMRNYQPVLDRVIPPRWPFFRWEPSVVTGVLLGSMLLASLMNMSDVSKFLYFQF